MVPPRLCSPPQSWEDPMLEFGTDVVHSCHVGSSILRHFEASRSWSWCQRRTQLTSTCDIIMGKFSAFPFFYPYLFWEQEAIEPRLKSLESPRECLLHTLVPTFSLLLLSPSPILEGSTQIGYSAYEKSQGLWQSREVQS